jgi:hypothetical protein
MAGHYNIAELPYPRPNICLQNADHTAEHLPGHDRFKRSSPACARFKGERANLSRYNRRLLLDMPI